ncbi:MAG: hypothetical protein FWH40_03885 [Coriobacteriia bacterium]|nr:hypothetical protein [Coriobacteriia bacterium]MCL2136647.1 hypothetical protein [Coriobacteriia bacterium]
MNRLSTRRRVSAGISIVSTIGAVIIALVLILNNTPSRVDKDLLEDLDKLESIGDDAVVLNGTHEDIQTFYAMMDDWNMGADPYKISYALDDLEWLEGDEAVLRYMEDRPSATREEAETETEEYGYIYNANADIKWYTTTEDTEFFIYDIEVSIELYSTDHQTFLDTMINSKGLTGHYPLVLVTVSGDTILRMERVFTPANG